MGSIEDGKKLIQNGGSDITAIAEANGIRTSRWLFDSIECGKLVDVSSIRSSGTIYAPSYLNIKRTHNCNVDRQR